MHSYAELVCIAKYRNRNRGIYSDITICGAAEEGKIKDICRIAITFVYLCGILIGIIGFFCTPYILDFMEVPADARDAALPYTRIVFCGFLYCKCCWKSPYI